MNDEALKECLDLLKRTDNILLQDSKDMGHAARLSALIEGILSDYGLASDPSYYGNEKQDLL